MAQSLDCNNTVLAQHLKDNNIREAILLIDSITRQRELGNDQIICYHLRLLKELNLHDTIRAKSELTIANMYHSPSSRDLRKSLEHAQIARDLAKKTYGQENKLYIASLNTIAQVLKEQGKLKEAEVVFLEAKRNNMKVTGGKDLQFARICNNLADVYCALNRFDKAEELYRTSLRVKEQLKGIKDEYTKTIYNLCKFYLAITKYSSGLKEIDVALAILIRNGNNDTLKFLDLKAILLYKVQKYKEAESIFKQTLQTREKIGQAENDDYCLNLLNYASLLQDRSRFDDAKPLVEKALIIGKKTFGLEHPYYASILTNYGDILTNTNDFKNAASTYDLAAKILLKTFGREHIEYFSNQFHYARMLRISGQKEEALQLFKSIDAIPKKYIRTVSKYLSEYELEDLIRIYKDYHEEIYSFNASKLDNFELCELSWSNSVFYKSFILGKLIQKRQALDNVDNIQDLRDELTSYYKQRESELRMQEVDRKNIFTLEETISRIESKISTQLNNLGKEEEDIDPSEIRSYLTEGSTGIEFVQYKNKDSVFYAAILINATSEHPQFIPICDVHSLYKLIGKPQRKQADYVSRIYSSNSRGLKLEDLPNKDIRTLLWEPLEKYINRGSDIYISLTGLLHRINFSAIPLELDTVVSQNYTLHVMNSLSDLIPDEKRLSISQSNKALVIGGLEYGTEDQQTLAIRAGSGESARFHTWNTISWTKKEIEQISQELIASGIESTILSGKYGTEEGVRENLSSGNSYRIIHLSSHGFFEEEEEGKASYTSSLAGSGLVLSNANEAQFSTNAEKDGLWSALEISSNRLNSTELVVLSACETGLGRIHQTEGVYGLQRAFKLAGSRYIIMSLWQVPDRETKEFMTAFYKFWLTGKNSIPKAFQKAQNEIRERYISPYQWAGFILLE
ncbi:MAG: CHAT domain-containing tetratricopeptide repeat protein [Saprospiraceae bacterium]